MVRYYSDLNLPRAFKAQTQSLGVLSRSNDENVLKQAICKLFIGTSMYFDNVLTENKAMIIAEEIFAKHEYRSLKLEDLVAICIEIKESNTFKLTPARILNHIADYTKRRTNHAIQYNLNKVQDVKMEANLDERIRKSVRFVDDSNKIIAKKRVQTRKYYK